MLLNLRLGELHVRVDGSTKVAEAVSTQPTVDPGPYAFVHTILDCRLATGLPTEADSLLDSDNVSFGHVSSSDTFRAAVTGVDGVSLDNNAQPSTCAALVGKTNIFVSDLRPSVWPGILANQLAFSVATSSTTTVKKRTSLSGMSPRT